MCKILKATALQRENIWFFLWKVTFSNFVELQQDSYTVALNFSAKEINSTRKKSVFAICKIMNVNIDFCER